MNPYPKKPEMCVKSGCLPRHPNTGGSAAIVTKYKPSRRKNGHFYPIACEVFSVKIRHKNMSWFP